MPVVVAPLSEDDAAAIQRRVKEAERSRERILDRPPKPDKDGFGDAAWDDQKRVWISRLEGDNPQIMTWNPQKRVWQSKILYLWRFDKGVSLTSGSCSSLRQISTERPFPEFDQEHIQSSTSVNLGNVALSCFQRSALQG